MHHAHSFSYAATSETVWISAPVNGWTSSFARLASAMKAGRCRVAMKDSRMISTRSFGTPPGMT